MGDTPEQAQTWTQRVGKTLGTVEQFTGEEVKNVATSFLEEKHLLPPPEGSTGDVSLSGSFAERVPPQKCLEQILAKVSAECIKDFLKPYLGETQHYCSQPPCSFGRVFM